MADPQAFFLVVPRSLGKTWAELGWACFENVLFFDEASGGQHKANLITTGSDEVRQPPGCWAFSVMAGSRVQWDPILPAGTCYSRHRMGQSLASEVRTMGWHRTLGLPKGQKKKEKLRYFKKKSNNSLAIFPTLCLLPAAIQTKPEPIIHPWQEVCAQHSGGGHSWPQLVLFSEPLWIAVGCVSDFYPSRELLGEARQSTHRKPVPTSSRHQSLQTCHLYFLSLFTKLLCGAKQRLRSDWQRVVCP